MTFFFFFFFQQYDRGDGTNCGVKHGWFGFSMEKMGKQRVTNFLR